MGDSFQVFITYTCPDYLSLLLLPPPLPSLLQLQILVSFTSTIVIDSFSIVTPCFIFAFEILDAYIRLHFTLDKYIRTHTHTLTLTHKHTSLLKGVE